MNINNKYTHFRLNFPSSPHKIQKGDHVRNVIYEKENAIFRLNQSDVINRLKVHSTEYNVADATKLLNFISKTSDDSVRIPKKNYYFRYLCLHLVDQGKGDVICKICRISYPLNEIKIKKNFSGIQENLLPVFGNRRCGWINWPKWIERIFTEQQPEIANFGRGRIAIQCEKEHKLLGMKITTKIS